MKKIILLFITFLIFISVSFALTSPRWMTQPIRVYVPSNTSYTALMKKAFSTWETKSNGIVKFKYVSKESEAGIVVSFVDFVSCNSKNAVGCTSYGLVKNGHYTKIYVSIGTKDLVQKNKERSQNHLYGVMLHEIGHAIGLGHSVFPQSVMYGCDLNKLQYLTDDDMKLLYNKYR